MQRDHRVIDLAPAFGNIVDHAHGAHYAGIAYGLARKVGRLEIELVGYFQALSGELVGHHAKNEDHKATSNGNCAKGRMQDKNQDEVNGHPGQVEKGENRVTAKVIAQHLHVPERALVLWHACRAARGLEILLQDVAGKQVVELDAGPDQQTGANPFQQGQQQQGQRGRKGDDHER